MRAGREPKIQISDSCAQTKRHHEALEFEVIEDFSVRSSATEHSSVRSAAARTNCPCQVCDVTTKKTLVRHEEHSELSCPNHRSSCDVPAGFLPTPVRGWLLLRNSRLGTRERATVLSATIGKLRSQWSDADLATYDRHSTQKGHERRYGNARDVNGSDDVGHDMRKPQDQPGEFNDGA